MEPDEKDARLKRGSEIYEANLVKKPYLEVFVVESESGGKSYEVCRFKKFWLCTCTDFAIRGMKERHWYCKHIIAVRKSLNHKIITK